MATCFRGDGVDGLREGQGREGTGDNGEQAGAAGKTLTHSGRRPKAEVGCHGISGPVRVMTFRLHDRAE